MGTQQEALELLREVGFKAIQFSEVVKVLSAWKGRLATCCVRTRGTDTCMTLLSLQLPLCRISKTSQGLWLH